MAGQTLGRTTHGPSTLWTWLKEAHPALVPWGCQAGEERFHQVRASQTGPQPVGSMGAGGCRAHQEPAPRQREWEALGSGLGLRTERPMTGDVWQNSCSPRQRPEPRRRMGKRGSSPSRSSQGSPHRAGEEEGGGKCLRSLLKGGLKAISLFLLDRPASSLSWKTSPLLVFWNHLFPEPHGPPSNSRSVITAGAPANSPLRLGFPLGPAFLLSLCPSHTLPSLLGSPPRLSPLGSALCPPWWAPSENTNPLLVSMGASVYSVKDSRGTCSPLSRGEGFYDILFTLQDRKGFK